MLDKLKVNILRVVSETISYNWDKVNSVEDSLQKIYLVHSWILCLNYWWSFMQK